MKKASTFSSLLLVFLFLFTGMQNRNIKRISSAYLQVNIRRDNTNGFPYGIALALLLFVDELDYFSLLFIQPRTQKILHFDRITTLSLTGAGHHSDQFRGG